VNGVRDGMRTGKFGNGSGYWCQGTTGTRGARGIMGFGSIFIGT